MCFRSIQVRLHVVLTRYLLCLVIQNSCFMNKTCKTDFRSATQWIFVLSNNPLASKTVGPHTLLFLCHFPPRLAPGWSPGTEQRRAAPPAPAPPPPTESAAASCHAARPAAHCTLHDMLQSYNMQCLFHACYTYYHLLILSCY